MTTITSSPRRRWKPGLSFWIFVGLIVGVAFGLLLPDAAKHLEDVGAGFIRLIKMLVAPLVFSTLVVGLCGAGHSNVGRLLAKALIWFWLATAVALAVGLGTANISKPGKGVTSQATPEEEKKQRDQAIEYQKKKEAGDFALIKQVIPTSIVDALAQNSLLQIVLFSLFFGLGLSAARPKTQVIIDGLKEISEAMFKVTGYVMYAAPVGAGGAIAYVVAKKGISVLWVLAKLVISLYIALVVFVILLLIIVKLVTRIRLKVLFKEIGGSLFYAFSTASSESVLPRLMKSLERLGVPEKIVGLVIPTGYSFNLDGTTLYLSLAAMFIVQADQKAHLFDIGQQLALMFTLLIASKGVAAVPRASLIVLSSACLNFNLDAGWVATILAVDTIMDMARTSVNVLGNACASIVVAKWEKSLPRSGPLYTGILPEPQTA